MPYFIHPDIRQAETLPAEIYTDPVVYERAKESVFAQSWQFITDTDGVKVPGQIYPFSLLEGCVDEPLLFTRDNDDALHCLANVCTHRGHIAAEQAGVFRAIRCRYHGRRFGLDGAFQTMPEFEGVCNFPTPADNLTRVPFGQWSRFLFASLSPAQAFEEWIAPMQEHLSWMPLEQCVYDPTRTREYLVRANWALYVENYLDALHIPFVHNELASQLDSHAYRFTLHPRAISIVGGAEEGEARFDLPLASPEYGQNIAAYYFWLFPNTMFNIYPWGVSVIIVRPVGVGLTKVLFLRYVWNSERLAQGVGADAAVDRVEREDEAVVEGVQKGVRSRFYTRGRYSPTGEAGTHHFHRMLAEVLAQGER